MSQRTRNRQARTSRRSPCDEWEAWLAGLIVTDGTVNKWGQTVIRQKAAAEPTLRRVGLRYGRPIHLQRQRSHINGRSYDYELATLDFCNLPVRWKRAVPQFQAGSDLERHYWRGVIDGDGCIYFTNQRRNLDLAWSESKYGFLGAAYCTYLDRLGVHYTVCHGQRNHGIAKARVRAHGDATALAEHLYGSCEIALPWKVEKAFRPCPEVSPMPRDRTHCPQGHAYDKANTYVSRDGRKRKCRACDRLLHAARRL